MRGVAGEKHPAIGPLLRQPGMECIDRLAHDAALRRGLMRLHQMRYHAGRQHLGVGLVIVQHEFVAPRIHRPRQRDTGALGIGIDLGVRRRARRIFQIDDQPAFAEGRAAHGDAERLAHRARSAVAGDQIIAAEFERAAPRIAHPQQHAVGSLLERCQLVAKRGGDMRETVERLAQLPLQDRLAEGIAARKTERFLGRLHLGEAAALGRIIMRTVAGDRLRQHFIGETGGLHGAQGLIVDRHRARLVHRRRVALEQQRFDAVDAEQIGERQPGGAAADDRNGEVGFRHAPCAARSHPARRSRAPRKPASAP